MFSDESAESILMRYCPCMRGSHVDGPVVEHSPLVATSGWYLGGIWGDQSQLVAETVLRSWRKRGEVMCA